MSELTNNILIPVDFNDLSLIAMEQSYNLGRLLGLDLVLLYVYEEPGLLRGLFSEDDFRQRRFKIEERLGEIAEKAKKDSGLEVSIMVREGKVHGEIVRVADILQSRFIIMGTRSQDEDTNSGRAPIGANTSRVIRSAPCPVITINNPHLYKGCRSILLPLDLTQETRQKVNKAIEIAKHFNATVKVMSALWSKNNESVVYQLNVQLKQVRDFIEAAGVKCQAELVEASGKEKSLVPIILRYAKAQGDIDLIIIMTQQELSLIEYFVSSSAQEIIRSSDIPVMSIIPRELGFSSMMS